MAAAFAQLQEGKDYKAIPPQPVESGKKIEVIEFFSYGCPHCADLEPYLSAWLKKLPADVQFRRIPVVFSARWEPLARIYYTLDVIGAEQNVGPAVFDALHKQKLQLWEEKTFFEWAAKQGLDRNKVEEAYKSFGVNSKVMRSKALVQTYRVESVPYLIVDGKWALMNVAHSATPAALDTLIAKARGDRPKG